MVLAHMEQHLANGDSAPDAPPIPDVLASLLSDILTPLARRRRDDVATAADILALVGATIERELFLVVGDGCLRSPACRRLLRSSRIASPARSTTGWSTWGRLRACRSSCSTG
jgi:hypothetical protein